MSRNLTIEIPLTLPEKKAISHIVKSGDKVQSRCLRYTITNTNGEINCLFLDSEVKNIIKTLKSEMIKVSCYGHLSLDDMRKVLKKFEEALRVLQLVGA